ncbi:MAG: hypothetical protein HY690_11295 [Chloroflexi bacterium]|nr:hypothetical protein [Chloroflexota bacterium]
MHALAAHIHSLRRLICTVLAIVLVALASGTYTPVQAQEATVRVAGTVLNPGWTPPGIAQVTLCSANYGCRSVATNNGGQFVFENVPMYQSIFVEVQTGIAVCQYDRYTGQPWFANTWNLGLLYCWN